MNFILRISWRTIFRHKGKSFVIGTILYIGALLMTVGNGIVSGLDRGIQKNIVEGFTGDIVIINDKHESDNAFMEAGGKALEPILNYKSIDTVLKNMPTIQKWLPIGKNLVITLNKGGNPLGQGAIGVDFSQYKNFFGDNLIIKEGRFPANGENGALITVGFRNKMGENACLLYTPAGSAIDTSSLSLTGRGKYKNWTVENDVVYMGQSVYDNTSTDIRSPVKAVFKYRCLNSLLNFFHIIDIESYRECMGYFSAQSTAGEIKAESNIMLNLEKNFMDNMFTQGNLLTSVGKTEFTDLKEGSLIVHKDTAINRNVDIDAGAYNLILIRLNDNKHIDKSVKEITKILHAHNFGVRAVSWKKTIEPVSSLAMMIRGALFMFVMGLFFVAIVIIINTLSMAAYERTSEFGMMRAVGAGKSFITGLFFCETALLSFFFGGLGIITGMIVVKILNVLKFTTDNDMLAMLYGGEIFNPYLSGADIILACIQLTIVTLVAVLYPLSIARRITPLDATVRD